MTKTPPETGLVRRIADALPGRPGMAYDPSDDQRKVKAKFWLRFRENPVIDRKDVTPALVEQLTGVSVQAWTKDTGFWDWFNVSDQVKENLEIAAERASELALKFLDPLVPMNDNARVQLIKYVLEFAGRAPPQRKEVKWHDKEIAEMTQEQLDALIARLTSRATPPT